MWIGQVSRSSGLAKSILQGIVKGEKKKKYTEKDGKTVLTSGQELSLPAQLRQLSTGQG